MKIAVLLTGGTILSEEKPDCYALSEKRKKEILSLIPNRFEAEVFSPYMILSEQLDGEYLTALIDEVGKALENDYGGVMILHGTDTLQYSAAALALAYNNADIPIVLVSSNYVLDDERSNGRDNIYYAAKFIEQKVGGVFVSYKNTGENPTIYFGNSLLPHLPYSDNLYSIYNPYGYFEDEEFVDLTGGVNLSGIGKYSLSKKSPVLWIKAAAGMTLPDVSNYRAILIETYHSGTLPTESDNFVNFCKNCDIPIYTVGAKTGKQYSSSKRFDDLKIEILPSFSPIFAYIMLWQMYSF